MMVVAAAKLSGPLANAIRYKVSRNVPEDRIIPVIR
jgi:hypothetical protein